MKGRKKTGRMWKRISFQTFISGRANSGLLQNVRKRSAFSRCESSWGPAWGKEISPRLQLHSCRQILACRYLTQVKQVHCTEYMSGHPKLGFSVLGLSASSVMFVKSDQCSEYQHPLWAPVNIHKIIGWNNEVIWDIFFNFCLSLNVFD